MLSKQKVCDKLSIVGKDNFVAVHDDDIKEASKICMY